jgi:hypothetical protein
MPVVSIGPSSTEAPEIPRAPDAPAETVAALKSATEPASAADVAAPELESGDATGRPADGATTAEEPNAAVASPERGAEPSAQAKTGESTAAGTRPAVAGKRMWLAAAIAVVVMAALAWAALRKSPKPEPVELEAEPKTAAQPSPPPAASAPAAPEPEQPAAEQPQPSAPDEQVDEGTTHDKKKAGKKSSRRRRWWSARKRGTKASDSADDDEDEAPAESKTTRAAESGTTHAAAESSITPVTLNVVPAGTLVYRGGQSEGSAPLTYGIKQGERVVLRLVKQGYATQSVILDGSRTKVSVVMVKQGGAGQALPGDATSPSTSSSPLPSGSATGTE